MKKTPCLLIFLFLSVFSFSQKIENVHAEQQGKQVVITYDIAGAQNSQIFDVKLFYSQNGYDWKQAVNGITGDIGNTVISGTNKSITWEVLQDVDKLVGIGFMFKVKALTSINVLYNETGTFSDSRDGKTYKWVKIGEQIWMAENLNFKTLERSWCYKGNDNCQSYGRLYDWETAKTVCPKDWHLPTDDEWTVLIYFLGGKYVAGGKMKQSGTTNWNSPNANATNNSGFTALPGGYLDYYGRFDHLGFYAHFWSSTEKDTKYAWSSSLHYNYPYVSHEHLAKLLGVSVRCLKNK